MTRPLRAMRAFILRLWREPGAAEESASWHGLIRPFDGSNTADDIVFQGCRICRRFCARS